MIDVEKQKVCSRAGPQSVRNQGFSIKHVLLGLFISLFLVACGNEVETKRSVPDFILQLTDDNINDFTVRFAFDYLVTLDSLVNASTGYKIADDRDGLRSFRNQQWTPLYIEKKEYYQSVMQKNKARIYRASIDPLFDRFDKMINISVHLKHAILEHDEDRWQQTLALIERDKKAVTAVITASAQRR